MKRQYPYILIIIIFLLGWTYKVTAQFSEAGVQKLEIPVDAPDFTLKELRGERVSLKELRGKIVILSFFTTWCPICSEEFFSFDKFREETKDKNAIFLKVAIKAKEEDLIKYEKFSPILMDDSGSVAKAYGVKGHHETFLINREGKIVGRTFSEKDWTSTSMRNLIEHLLMDDK